MDLCTWPYSRAHHQTQVGLDRKGSSRGARGGAQGGLLGDVHVRTPTRSWTARGPALAQASQHGLDAGTLNLDPQLRDETSCAPLRAAKATSRASSTSSWNLVRTFPRLPSRASPTARSPRASSREARWSPARAAPGRRRDGAPRCVVGGGALQADVDAPYRDRRRRGDPDAIDAAEAFVGRLLAMLDARVESRPLDVAAATDESALHGALVVLRLCSRTSTPPAPPAARRGAPRCGGGCWSPPPLRARVASALGIISDPSPEGFEPGADANGQRPEGGLSPASGSTAAAARSPTSASPSARRRRRDAAQHAGEGEAARRALLARDQGGVDPRRPGRPGRAPETRAPSLDRPRRRPFPPAPRAPPATFLTNAGLLRCDPRWMRPAWSLGAHCSRRGTPARSNVVDGGSPCRVRVAFSPRLIPPSSQPSRAAWLDELSRRVGRAVFLDAARNGLPPAPRCCSRPSTTSRKAAFRADRRRAPPAARARLGKRGEEGGEAEGPPGRPRLETYLLRHIYQRQGVWRATG